MPTVTLSFRKIGKDWKKVKPSQCTSLTLRK
jgi:hypothetical protein